jgi:hypothetical protein
MKPVAFPECRTSVGTLGEGGITVDMRVGETPVRGRKGQVKLKAVFVGAPLLMLLSAGMVWATGVGMSNTWIDISVSRARCIQQATLAVKKAGFTSNFEVAGESLYADQEEYSALFRCVADKKLAYIVVAGPDSDLADHYVSDIEGEFGTK